MTRRTIFGVLAILALAVGGLVMAGIWRSASTPREAAVEAPQDQAVVARAAASGGQGNQKQAPKQDDSANVTVMAVLAAPEAGDAAGELTFQIFLNTHSVPLSKYDLTRITTFRNSEGLVVNNGLSWEAEGNSDHHRSGYLRIKAPAGNVLLSAKTRFFTLEFAGIGGVNRALRWERKDWE
ncbi:MAG: hypothetical protein M1379_13895 [Firmicutes bacterium]|nr:hypothetical protein [Bacillota bacterium]